jgi:hypothetical protein
VRPYLQFRYLSRFVVAAALCLVLTTHPLGAELRRFTQSVAQKDSPNFGGIERTVQKLLVVPVYTTANEKLLNGAGDSAAVAITKLVSEAEMNSPDVARRILLILHLAFEDPESIAEPSDKTATTALQLLDRLARTDYGQQPNVIGNARFEIKHNSSTGKPLEDVTFPGDPVEDTRHTEWIQSVMEWMDTVKPGMTRADLLKVFAGEGGISTRTRRTFTLRECPYIKVDVEFSVSKKEATDKIVGISRPYLEYPVLD